MKPFYIKARKRWAVEVPIELSDNGKRKREFFKTQQEATDYAKGRKDQNSLAKNGVPLFSAVDAVRLAKVLDLVGSIDLLEEAVSEWKKKTPSGDLITIKQAYELYYQAKQTEGMGKEYLGSIRVYLGKVLTSFGNRQLSSLAAPELTIWFDEMVGQDRKGKKYPLSPTTKKNVHVGFSSFLEWCERREYILRNPLRGVPRPKATRPKREIFTVAQMKKILSGIDGLDLVYVTLGAFAGLRSSEIEGNQDHQGIHWEDLDFKKKEIHISEERTKKRGRIIKMETAFIRLMQKTKIRTKGAIINLSDSELAGMRKRILEAGKMEKWPENGLRHSFGSYHLGAFENAPLTSLQIGHTDPATTLNHYGRAVSKSDALKWWKLGLNKEI